MASPKPFRAGHRQLGTERLYGPLVFRVLSRDPQGRPKDLVVGYDDDSFEARDGVEFVTGYLNAAGVRPKGVA